MIETEDFPAAVPGLPVRLQKVFSVDPVTVPSSEALDIFRGIDLFNTFFFPPDADENSAALLRIFPAGLMMDLLQKGAGDFEHHRE